jgi:hypothetical protein
MNLTDRERRIIAEARELAGLESGDAMRAYLKAAGTMQPAESDEMVYPLAFGHARWVLGELADIAEGLAGE